MAGVETNVWTTRRQSSWARALLLAVIGWLAIWATGVGSIFGPWSQAVIGNIVRIDYPTTGQEDATVLLFREENLRTLALSYPVPYAAHADILTALGIYHPRAVFIDFAFVDVRPREDPEILAQAICSLSKQGVQVKLAVTAPDETGLGILPTLLRDGCATPVDTTLDKPDSEAGLLTYSPGYLNKQQEFLPSPAFALLPSTHQIVPETAAAMELVWVPGNAPLNEKWMACRRKDFLSSIKQLATRGPLAMQESCPYTRTISVSHLLNTTDDNDVADALRGRTVFYGADFNMTGDRVPISLFEELPGIFVHAMAYDNLLSLGEDYKRADRGTTVSQIIDFLLLFLAAFMLARFSPPEIDDFEALSRRLTTTVTGIGGIIFFALGGVLLGGAEGGILAGFLAYLAYRCLLDTAFAVFCVVTGLMSLVAYTVFDLGPRNVLLFVALFQVVRALQERLQRLVQRYSELRDRQGAHCPASTVSQRIIGRIFDKLQTLV